MAKLNIALKLDGSVEKANDLGTVSAAFSKERILELAAGTGNGQADRIFADTRTLAASANEDLDLNGAGLSDPFGVALAFARVKAILVFASASNTNDVVVGGAASNGFFAPFGASTDKIKVRPGGFACLACTDATGWAVTAATADLLRVANGAAGSSVDYDIVIVGASA